MYLCNSSKFKNISPQLSLTSMSAYVIITSNITYSLSIITSKNLRRVSAIHFVYGVTILPENLLQKRKIENCSTTYLVLFR